MMRILLAGSPKMPIRPNRSKNVDWDDIQAVTLPEASQSATTACGSRQTWHCREVANRSS